MRVCVQAYSFPSSSRSAVIALWSRLSGGIYSRNFGRSGNDGVRCFRGDWLSAHNIVNYIYGRQRFGNAGGRRRFGIYDYSTMSAASIPSEAIGLVAGVLIYSVICLSTSVLLYITLLTLREYTNCKSFHSQLRNYLISKSVVKRSSIF